MLAIRPMHLADLDTILSLEQSAHLSPWSRDSFVTSLAAHYLCWCLEQSQQIICAYAVLMPAIDELHILNITVASTYRRQGYAQYLLDAACEFAKQHYIPKLLLEVRPSNTAALSLYRRYGFQEIGQRPGYYSCPDGTREAAIVMTYLISHAAPILD